MLHSEKERIATNKKQKEEEESKKIEQVLLFTSITFKG